MIDLKDPRIAAVEVTPMWSGEMPIEVLDKALLQHGVDAKELPRAPSRVMAMQRAFEALAPRGAIIDTIPNGVSLTLKDPKKLDLELYAPGTREAFAHSTVLSCKISVLNTNGTEIETVTFTPPDHPLLPLMLQTYEQKKSAYKMSEDVSVWFSRTVIPKLGGIPKRSRGGVYYVARDRADYLMKVSAALDTISHSMKIDRSVGGVSVPITRLNHGGKLCMEGRTTDDTAAVEIMIDNVIREADNTIDDLSAAITSGKLGVRALSSKKDQASALEKEIATWENLASVSLQFLHERVTELTKAIGVAELACKAANATD